jgi:hypothetical protein
MGWSSSTDPSGNARRPAVLKCVNCAGEDRAAEYICSGWSLCDDCYALWCEIPEDLHPYLTSIFNIISDAEEHIANGDREDFDTYVALTHWAVSEFRGRMTREGRTP